jgi:hypothetical protein
MLPAFQIMNKPDTENYHELISYLKRFSLKPVVDINEREREKKKHLIP